ncbi:MAG: Cell surface glycoprotein [Candidatus Argoarchaeum ethanivorans]|uniref:Cell surface glycoprotein n=1 Tax=Candidatus Argoarchaeum ethanivorans TaxID=2608793 RepID=A0A811T7H0_9EURY|nr:MAG: Cell surface glycoprotein [Candidatus Argoarchaeum ethanivorans]
MKRNKFWKVSVFALFFAVLAVISIGCASADTIYVPEGGNQTIQQAVNNASEGDTIIVRDGTYNENVDVGKSYLTIRSENGSANCIVNASNSNDHVFDVQQNYVNISGFTVENATEYPKAGIYLNGRQHCSISSNNASNNYYGIYLYSSSNNNTLTNNTASNNYYGIRLYQSSNNNTLTNNTASNNDYGIYLEYSSNNNTLTNNNASSNSYGIWLQSSSNNTLTNNTANSNNYYGICLDSSSNNTLTENTASNSNYGIYLDSSSNNLLYHNNLINNTNNNAYDTSTNQWNTSTVGNYYSDYTGSDNDSDGIGDTSHQILGGSSIDYFPLMHPWGKPPLKGDLDDDDKITSKDAAIVLQIAVGSHPCNPQILAIADVSGDGRVSSLDALMILQNCTTSLCRK